MTFALLLGGIVAAAVPLGLLQARAELRARACIDAAERALERLETRAPDVPLTGR